MKLTLSTKDISQILDALAIRKETWANTVVYLENGNLDSDCMIAECSDVEEAESITNEYSRIIDSINEQLEFSRIDKL